MESNQLRKVMLKEFGLKEYERMYNFFLEVIVSDHYDYKIIKTRRAFVLFQLFLSLFKSQYWNKFDQNFDEQFHDSLNSIYNDCILGNTECISQFAGKKILIVDDILIHGRALGKFIDRLKSVVEIKNISVAVLMRNGNAECVSDDLKKALEKLDEDYLSNSDGENFLKCHIEYDESSWQTFSNKIVNVIQQSGIAYSVFVPQYRATSESLVIPDDIYQVVPDPLEIQEISALKMSFFFWKGGQNRESKNIVFFLRKYTFASGETLYVPLALLPTITAEQYEKILAELRKSFYKNKGCAMLDTCVVDVAADKNGEKIKFGYKLLTYLLSDLVYRIFAKKMQIEAAEIPEFLLNATFGEEISMDLRALAKHVNELQLDEMFKLVEKIDDLCEPKMISNESSDLFNGLCLTVDLKRSTTTTKTIDSLIRTYIDEIHQKNEGRARKKQSRLEGIYWSTMHGSFFSKLSADWKQEIYLVARLCSKWDSGAASYIVEYHEDSGVVGGSIIDGEQAYHEVIQSESADEVNCFYEVFRRNGEKMEAALVEYCGIMAFVGKHGILDASKMESVYRYFSRCHSVDTLKACIYPETSSSTNVQTCLMKYKKEWENA